MDYRISDKMKEMKPSAIREIFKSLTDPSIIAFAAGNPAPESFPAEAIARFSADIMANDMTTALQYGITEGYPALREAVSARLAKKFGISGADNTLIITSGGQQGLELAAKVMCNEGDTILCENPSFIGALNAFRSLGANLVGVDMEEDGVSLDALEKALNENPRAKLLYLIPTFHNPAGTTMSIAKRKAVYDLCLKHNVLILEDNPYGELRFAGEDVPTIKSMDTENIVLYCGSFSKILSAGMRVGFLMGPDEVMRKVVVAKQVEDVHTNNLAQMLCHRFLTDFDADGHIAGIQQLYRRKSGLMLDEMDRLFPAEIKFTRPQGGLFLWCTLPDGVDTAAFVQTALAKKVAVVPGSTFNADPKAPSQSFRLNYSTPSDEQIVRGIAILAETAKEFLK